MMWPQIFGSFGLAAWCGGLIARFQEAPQIAAMTLFAIGAILGAGLIRGKGAADGATRNHDLLLTVTTFALSLGTLALGLLGLRGAAIALMVSAVAIAVEFLTDHDAATRPGGAAGSALIAVYDPDTIAIGDIVELIGIPPAAVRTMEPQGVEREQNGRRNVAVRLEVALPSSVELLSGLNRASVVAGVTRIDITRR